MNNSSSHFEKEQSLLKCKLSQEEVWNEIAELWSKFRRKSPEDSIEFLKNKKGRILDLGCGSGRNLVANPNIIYYGVDFSGNMLKFAKQKAQDKKINTIFLKADIGKEKLPFNSDFFDSAIFISTLHCIESEKNRENALKEFYRVLKKDGEAMITIWNKEANKNFKNLKAKECFANWKKDGKIYRRYYYFYDKEELQKLLEEIGFKILAAALSGDENHSKKNLIFYVKK